MNQMINDGYDNGYDVNDDDDDANTSATIRYHVDK
jgi:hypothetical protein